MWKKISIIVLLMVIFVGFSLFAADKEGITPVKMGMPMDKIVFTSDRSPLTPPGYPNWDIYIMNRDGTGITRLTTNPAIDNHPDLSGDGTKIVFSSNRDGDFEIYTALVVNVEGTITQITFNDTTPDRHPHWSHDGRYIIFSSKRKCGTLKRDQCSIPVDPECDDSGRDGSLYEGLAVYDSLLDVFYQLDLRTAAPWWPADNATNEGHASFSPDGSKILFAGDTAGHGNDWEVYVMDWGGGSSISNLEQVTQGPWGGPNPIQISAGAHFS